MLIESAKKNARRHDQKVGIVSYLGADCDFASPGLGRLFSDY